MNAEYIYEIFQTAEKEHTPDLNIGMAMLQKTKPVQDHAELKRIREFIGRHYDTLTNAYLNGDRASFAAAVVECEAEDAEQEEK